MNQDAAIGFLKEHQPLPSSRDGPNDLFLTFNTVRKVLSEHPVPGALDLVLGAMGDGDGHGTYSFVEDLLRRYPREEVVRALNNALHSKLQSTRYWSASFASAFPDSTLEEALVQVLRCGETVDERVAAATALEQLGSETARLSLQEVSRREPDGDLVDAVRVILNEWG